MDNEKFSARLYAMKILNDHVLFTDKNNILWLYDPETGLWNNNAERIVEKDLREWNLKPEHRKSYNVREVMADLKALCFENKEFPEATNNLIPFNNCIHDLERKEFVKFDPDHYLISKLAVNYNPESRGCPLIDKTFSEFVKPEELSDLYELAAYCMVPNYKIQEFFMLLGSGRNGKSVYANIITRLLGKDNVSAVSLDTLQGNNFAGADLHGKFANICQEMSYKDLSNTDLIKRLTGGDIIRAERKFQQPFYFRNYAKLVFLTNSLPITKDKTDAFYRRARIIRFPFSFEGEREDRYLMEKITQQEIEGLACKSIEVLRGMTGRGLRFTREISLRENERLYEDLSEPIVTFIKERCQEDPDGFIIKEEFKKRLDDWLRKEGQRIRDDKDISAYMKDHRIDDQRKSLSSEVRKNAWVGLRWKD